MKQAWLLDTNVLLWALNDDRRLSGRVRRALATPSTAVRVSVVSAWEIAIKHQGGKLDLTVPIEKLLGEILSGSTWPILPILPAHVLGLLDLPLLHRDPFDRLLVAQARAEFLTLVTADSQIRKYDVRTIA